MLVLNLYGGPGSGKSTLAALVYGTLKLKGHNVELVREAAKLYAWANMPVNQLAALEQQAREMDTVRAAGVDLVVTDSPLLLQGYYCHWADHTDLEPAIKRRHWDRRYTHIDILLRRPPTYNPAGRFQSYEEALAVDRGIEDYLRINGVTPLSVASKSVTFVVDLAEEALSPHSQ